MYIIGIAIVIATIIVIVVLRNKKIENELKNKVSQGDIQAHYDLARRYQRKKPGEATQLFEQAAKNGYAQAQLMLGLQYKEGNGIEKDSVQAIQWFHKAAEQGLAEAQYNYALCCRSGEGIEENPHQAAQWFEKAAEQNHAGAQYELGHCYMMGCGVDENANTAIYWFQKAADNGLISAQAVVGYKKIENHEDLKNHLGYNVIVKPLQYALVKQGYHLSGSCDKATYGYVGNIYITDESHKRIGSIHFASRLWDLGNVEYSLQCANLVKSSSDIYAGELKYMAIQNGKMGVLLRSDIATATNPPDIPEWLMIGAELFKASGYDFTDPDWVHERGFLDYRKYLNVMFR